MPKKRRIKVIVDTNIWVSHVYSNLRSPLSIVLKDETIEFAFSEELIQEVTEVIHRPKIAKNISREKSESFLSLLSQSVQFYKVTKAVSFGTDPDDYFLFSLAVKAKAHYLITGDKQLLELKKYKQLHIISLTEFIKLT
jgi:uncharacterized protein